MDKETCTTLLISNLENSDRKIERERSIQLLSKFKFTDLKDNAFFEQLFVSDDNLTIRLFALNILAKNFPNKVESIIEWALNNENHPDIIAGALKLALKLDIHKLRGFMIKQLSGITRLEVNHLNINLAHIINKFQWYFNEIIANNLIEQKSTEDLVRCYLNYITVVFLKKQCDPFDSLLMELKEGCITELNLTSNRDLNWQKLNDIPGLFNLDSLESLALNNCELESISEIKKLSKLQYLVINESLLTEINGLSNLKHLENLQLVKNKIKEISGLDNNIRLKVLCLDDNKISRITGLNNLKNLEYLLLERNEISEIEGLESLTNLERLYLGHNKIREAKNLGGLKSLREIYLEENKLQNFPDFSSLEKLERINLCNNRIKKVDGLEQISSLRHLSLSGNPIETIYNLEKVKNHICLFLEGIPYKESLFNYLENLKKSKSNLIFL